MKIDGVPVWQFHARWHTVGEKAAGKGHALMFCGRVAATGRRAAGGSGRKGGRQREMGAGDYSKIYKQQRWGWG